jgi:ferritin-like metal-binding protein YciE
MLQPLKGMSMAGPETLTDVYVDELRDLWSANDQMQSVLKEFLDVANDEKLKNTLVKSISGIADHTEKLKALVEANGGETSKEHCKGMEGLTKEARKHVIEEGASDEDLGDLLIISQYQRMSHYGLAGFGTAAAYAKALGMDDDEEVLKSIVEDIYKADELASRLAERLEDAAASMEMSSEEAEDDK